MMPTIFVTHSSVETLTKIHNLLLSQGIQPVNIHLFETEGSVGVADIKILQSESSFASTGGKKAIIIPHAEDLTLPAQNALLKLLEEPPENLLLFLVTNSLDILLPTIQSRCQIVYETTEKKVVPEYMHNDVREFLEHIMTASIGERLYWAQKMSKDKVDMIMFIDEAVRELHEMLVTNPTTEHALLLDRLINLKTILMTTNVNARLAVEDTLLGMENGFHWY